MSKKSDGGIVALRGFRKQFLHTLKRIITSKNNEVFYPEGVEDIDVYDKEKHIIERIQVKDYSNDLVKSNLKSFLKRIEDEIKSTNSITFILAHYGNIGSELKELAGKKPEQISKIRKNNSYGKEIWQYLVIQNLDEQDELETIKLFLNSYPMVRGEWEKAFHILIQELFLGAEARRGFTKDNIIEKLQQIGTYFTQCEAHRREWNTTIIPLDKYEIDSFKNLQIEFSEGIAVKWKHILANLDIIREQQLQKIVDGFNKNRIVIIHGASGQGKSALAYRYLHDFCPRATCYEIHDLVSSKRAFEIITAISTYKIPFIFYVDASFKDKGLSDFLKRVAEFPQIYCLVSIREEDWHLLDLTTADLNFTDIELTFEKKEAQYIFLNRNSTFLNFEEAWLKFNELNQLNHIMPLLEFVYLLNHTETLQNRLKQQYHRICDEIDCKQRSELDLKILKYIAILGAFGARINIYKLKKIIATFSLTRSIERLEKEYLICYFAEKNCLSTLHPIRSEILSHIITGLEIETWLDITLECFTFIEDEDIEIFLLYSFSKYPNFSKNILNHLNIVPISSWIMAEKIINVLLWKGVNEYIKQQETLIKDVYDVYSSNFWVILDFMLTNLGKNEKIHEKLLLSLQKGSNDKKEVIKGFLHRQLPKEQVFQFLDNWLKQRFFTLEIANDAIILESFGKVIYWLGFRGIDNDLLKNIDLVLLSKIIKKQPLQILSILIYGLCTCFRGNIRFIQWYNSVENILQERYQFETRTPYIEKNNGIIRAHFIVPFYVDIEEKTNNSLIRRDESYLNKLSMERVKLLATLFPYFDAYGCQGYGHQLISSPIDETTKTAIKSSGLVPEWTIKINKIARILSSQFFRPLNWEDYCGEILNIRKLFIDFMKQFIEVLSNYFKNQNFTQEIYSFQSHPTWITFSHKLAKRPQLPLCAISQFGYNDEGEYIVQNEEDNNKKELEVSAYLRQYQPYLKAQNDFFDGIENFVRLSPDYLLANSLFGRAKTKEQHLVVQQILEKYQLKVNSFYLTTFNLSNSLKTLVNYQQQYYQCFKSISNIEQLYNLEKEEITNLKIFWSLWFHFINEPKKILKKAGNITVSRLENLKLSIENSIKKTLKILSTNKVNINFFESMFKGNKVFVITIELDNFIDIYDAVGNIIYQLRKSIGCAKAHSFKYHALEFQWQSFFLIPLYHGKLINPTIFKLDSHYLIMENISNEQIISSIKIDVETLNSFELQLWYSATQNNAWYFWKSFRFISSFLQHLFEMERLPNLDDLGNHIIQSYIKESEIIFNNYIQCLSDSIIKLCEQESNNEVNHQHLIKAKQTLIEISPILTMKEFNLASKLTLEQLKILNQQLNSIENQVFSICLLWSTFLIDNE